MLKLIHPRRLPQDQYVFIHDSINELLVCGDTEMVTADLCHVMNKLQEVGQEGGMSGYETQFKASHLHTEPHGQDSSFIQTLLISSTITHALSII